MSQSQVEEVELGMLVTKVINIRVVFLCWLFQTSVLGGVPVSCAEMLFCLLVCCKMVGDVL